MFYLLLYPLNNPDDDFAASVVVKRRNRHRPGVTGRGSLIKTCLQETGKCALCSSKWRDRCSESRGFCPSCHVDTCKSAVVRTSDMARFCFRGCVCWPGVAQHCFSGMAQPLIVSYVVKAGLLEDILHSCSWFNSSGGENASFLLEVRQLLAGTWWD